MFTGVNFEKAIDYWKKGREVIVIDRNSKKENGGYDNFPFEDLFRNVERLPEESLNSVIGWDEYRERCCFVQYYGGRWILGADREPIHIIAWRPLPGPYRPERRI